MYVSKKKINYLLNQKTIKYAQAEKQWSSSNESETILTTFHKTKKTKYN